ncbi:MAG: antitoxin Xre/MbcA/ParS toxin-binding domain-containing protein [Aestuariibacter sp.]
MEKIRAAAMGYFHDARLTKAWLETPCRTFNNKTPLEYAQNPEQEAKVLSYLAALNPNLK